MKIYFHIPYQTTPDESLCAVVFLRSEHKTLRQQIHLESTDAVNWSGHLTVSTKDHTLTYSYYVLKAGKISRQEWNIIPRIEFLSEHKKIYHLYDLWRDLPEQSWLYSQALATPVTPLPIPEYPSCLILRAYIPGLTQGQQPCICGSHAVLGGWDTTKAVPLIPSNTNEWTLVLDAQTLSFPLDYKFILKNESGEIQWELDGNRVLSGPIPAAKETYVYSGLMPHFKLLQPRIAGTVLPVFSIRTENDWGTGDFGSLKTLADWAASTGQKMIQILPVNDTSLTGTWQDSYPYNSVSVYAFHPLYADLSVLPPLPKKLEASFEKRRKQLNELPQMDYEAVVQLKNERLREAYKQDGKTVLASAAFREFWNENANWLPAYAMFSALRDQFGTADWQTWPQYSQFSKQVMYTFYTQNSPSRDNAYFYFYVQFLLHTQLIEAHQYARSKGVSLKGDIPIGVSPYSTDAWTEPALFNLNAQAGAPPDDFSVTGQNWGFPTYNWEEMAKDGYSWWKRRFMHMMRYFDAYRIDHVLGFFRIWEIPLHSLQGLLGQFSPALPLSVQDMDAFGFHFDEKYTHPYISEEVLREVFGADAALVKTAYLTAAENGFYTLKTDYDTQRKIEKAFSCDTQEQRLKIRDGLYTLCNNVLFVPHRVDSMLYHPRISALQTTAFRALTQEQQQAYEQLYNDYFYRRQDEFWKQEALKKLPALTQSTAMLCCAEDLGMIPHCVPEVMNSLQMLSLEIQRMPKHLGEVFTHPASYPYISVATPSTHDMSVLRGWWTENPELTQRFWTEVLHREGQAPVDAPADACEQILRMHLESPSMLCMISWQDWTALDESLRCQDPKSERINIPANPRHYWRYRMHLTVESLMQQLDFNIKLKEMIEISGR